MTNLLLLRLTALVVEDGSRECASSKPQAVKAIKMQKQQPKTRYRWCAAAHARSLDGVLRQLFGFEDAVGKDHGPLVGEGGEREMMVEAEMKTAKIMPPSEVTLREGNPLGVHLHQPGREEVKQEEAKRNTRMRMEAGNLLENLAIPLPLHH